MPAAAGSEAVTGELSTEPSPAQKGMNQIRVQLTTAAGPLSGAQVTVRFFMPGMPAMGMSEMNEVAQMQEEGSGSYRGQVNLGSGGTWRVTITALQTGKTILTKQLSINASGGM